jgi:DNA modification methylase
MSTYYEDDLVTLYHGDCREELAWLEADVLVTDPPYGMAYKSGRTGATIVGDQSVDVRDAALLAWGGLKPALVFGTWRASRPAATRQVLIWDKTGGQGGSTPSPWLLSHEEVYVVGEAWRSGRTRRSGVLRVPNYNSQSDARPNHPTPKPVWLMELLMSDCPPGVVADPFAGSGSTLAAAKHLGRKAIGVELDERYCEIAATRLAQDVLFGGVA